MGTFPYLDKHLPAVWRELGSLTESVGSALEDAGVPRSTTELMNVRISQLNGCAFCVHVHTRKAVKAGVSPERLAQVPVWKDSGAFGDRERAALLLGEAVTVLPEPAVRDRDLLLAREHLGPEAFATLEWAATLMNTYNRLSILSHHPVPIGPESPEPSGASRPHDENRRGE